MDTTVLHIRCGDDILPKLKSAGLPGTFLKWCDPVCQGPLPAGLSPHEWRETRADFLAREYGVPLEDARSDLAIQDAGRDRFADYAEVVLWFEHDLFDQAILVCLLDWFASRDLGNTRLSLVCIGSFPGVVPFVGLGNLDAPQLAGLFPSRVPVTAPQFALARHAWAALRAPDPIPLLALLQADTGALPFLAQALKRHLQEFPALQGGLALTERLALEAVAEERARGGTPASGKGCLAQVFRAYQAREQHPWLGDTMLWSVLRRMASGPLPLLRSVGAWPEGVAPLTKTSDLLLTLTDFGQAVLTALAGNAGQTRPVDWIACGAPDRWVGGVLVSQKSDRWRWDTHSGTLVNSGAWSQH